MMSRFKLTRGSPNPPPHEGGLTDLCTLSSASASTTSDSIPPVPAETDAGTDHQTDQVGRGGFDGHDRHEEDGGMENRQPLVVHGWTLVAQSRGRDETTAPTPIGLLHAHAPTVEIIDVTPELAERWLAKNPNNRNIRKAVIDGYARDMTTGDWVLNGETLKFDTHGRLIDGQLRLSAVIVAGTTVPMIVVRGVDETVMDTVDAGAKRTYADALKLQGEENTTTLAAVARRAVMWSKGARTNTGAVRPTPREMNAFLETNPSIRTSAEVAVRLASRTLLPASVVGLCHWLFADLDTDDADWFLARVADGDGISGNSPVAALRNRIVKMRVSGGRVNETEALALVIYAWNAQRAGETRTKLQMPKGGLTPENFPEPR